MLQHKTEHEKRVLAMLEQRWVGRTGFTERQGGIRRLLAQWPAARRIQFAGGCHCGGLMYSFVVPEYQEMRGDLEMCGYYCIRCGFSNAGARDPWRRQGGRP